MEAKLTRSDDAGRLADLPHAVTLNRRRTKADRDVEQAPTDYGFFSTTLPPSEQRLRKYLISFAMVDQPSEEEQELAKDFVVLDHRSLRLLGPDSHARGEVRDLLVNVIVFFHQRELKPARRLLDRAQEVCMQHLQARNRLRYLIGMVLGGAANLAFGVVLAMVPGLIGPLDPTRLASILLFAFMGAVTSVLLRLSQIDLHDQTSPTLVFVSGATRPVTAAFFATVLALLISSRVLDLHLGPSPSQGSDQLLLPISFLCGFSERFASDILSRLGGDARAADLAAARSSIRRPRAGTA